MDTPRTFTEVPGWREEFAAAAERLDQVRTLALFPELPNTLCGESIRPLTLADWTILDQADNPLVAGGTVTLAHCANLLWLLSPRYRPDCRLARFKRRLITWRIMLRCGEGGAIDEVIRFVDDAFLDSPGRFSSKKQQGVSVTNWPRKAFEIEICGEIMRAYPSFGYSDLRRMPLAQLWQWLHDARDAQAEKIQMHHPSARGYRNYQLTDHVNTKAVAELNRLRKAAANT